MKATLLSLLFPGLGHLYAGRLRVAVLLLVLPGLVFVALVAILVYLKSLGALLPVVLVGAVGFHLFQAFWAGSVADGETTTSVPPWAQQYPFYIGFVVMTLVLWGSMRSIVRSELAEFFQIPTGSMMPTLLVGDHVVARKFDLRIDVGDIVVYLSPGDPSKKYLKRVVAKGGDRVSIRNGVLLINDVALARQRVSSPPSPSRLAIFEERIGDRSYLVAYDSEPRDGADSEYVVPPGHVYVVGDNRNRSQDSRSYGPIPEDTIVGVAQSIYFSWGPDGIRWTRRAAVR